MKLKLFKKEIYLPSFFKIIFAIFPVVLLILFGFIITQKQHNEELAPLNNNIIESAPHTIDVSTHPATATPILFINVYLVGEVKNPDVYLLPEGSLLIHAIEAAGGATDKADLESVNLAYPLNNNMMIKIPSVNDNDKNWIIDKGNHEQASSSPAENHDNVFPGTQKLNINTATAAQLCTLPGIGESTARKIVNYREENGPFNSIHDITNIAGIKEAKFQQIKDYITVD
jgi:competence protein ComEA